MEETIGPIGTKTTRATRRACSTIPRILRASLRSTEFRRLKRDCWCEEYACRSISTERNDVRSARSLGVLSYRRFDATIRVKFSFARYDIGRSSTLQRSILAFTLVNASSGSVVPFFIGYVARSRLLTIPCRPAALISLISRDTGLSQREGADRIYYSPRVPT